MALMGGLIAAPSIAVGATQTRHTWTLEDGREYSMVRAELFDGGTWNSLGSREHCTKTYFEWLQHPSVYRCQLDFNDGTVTKCQYSQASYDRLTEAVAEMI